MFVVVISDITMINITESIQKYKNTFDGKSRIFFLILPHFYHSNTLFFNAISVISGT